MNYSSAAVTGAAIHTIVVCTTPVPDAPTTLDLGSIVYRVHAVYLARLDGDVDTLRAVGLVLSCRCHGAQQGGEPVLSCSGRNAGGVPRGSAGSGTRPAARALQRPGALAWAPARHPLRSPPPPARIGRRNVWRRCLRFSSRSLSVRRARSRRNGGHTAAARQRVRRWSSFMIRPQWGLAWNRGTPARCGAGTMAQPGLEDRKAEG